MFNGDSLPTKISVFVAQYIDMMISVKGSKIFNCILLRRSPQVDCLEDWCFGRLGKCPRDVDIQFQVVGLLIRTEKV